jgi:acylphosphatase
MKKVKLTIREKTEKIQDVGFRLCLMKEAQKQFITRFFAENLQDKKTVEVLVGGRLKDVDRYIETVKRMRTGNPKGFDVETQDYDGNIMDIRDFAGYLTAEQLVKGVGGMTGLVSRIDTLDKTLVVRLSGLETTLKGIGPDIARAILEGFERLEKRG